jgi:hypothetical protein
MSTNQDQAHRRYRAKLKIQTLKAYSRPQDPAPCCVKCGQADPDKLHLDHIAGDRTGTDDRERRCGSDRGGWPFYQKLRRAGYPNKDKMQILCADCNLSAPKFGKEYWEKQGRFWNDEQTTGATGGQPAPATI